MRTTIVKISDNEYRVQDILPYNTSDGVKQLDYGVDFNQWNDNIDEYRDKNPSLWYKIEVDEFKNFGCGIIYIWNRNNHHQFDTRYTDLNPIMRFAEKFYKEDSQNEYANLILNLFKLNIIDKCKIKHISVRGNRHGLSNFEIEETFNEKKVFLVEIYSYGYNNSLVAHVNKDNFNEESIPEYDAFREKYLKLLKKIN